MHTRAVADDPATNYLELSDRRVGYTSLLTIGAESFLNVLELDERIVIELPPTISFNSRESPTTCTVEFGLLPDSVDHQNEVTAQVPPDPSAPGAVSRLVIRTLHALNEAHPEARISCSRIQNPDRGQGPQNVRLLVTDETGTVIKREKSYQFPAIVSIDMSDADNDPRGYGGDIYPQFLIYDEVTHESTGKMNASLMYGSHVNLTTPTSATVSSSLQLKLRAQAIDIPEGGLVCLTLPRYWFEDAAPSCSCENLPTIIFSISPDLSDSSRERLCIRVPVALSRAPTRGLVPLYTISCSNARPAFADKERADAKLEVFSQEALGPSYLLLYQAGLRVAPVTPAVLSSPSMIWSLPYTGRVSEATFVFDHPTASVIPEGSLMRITLPRSWNARFHAFDEMTECTSDEISGTVLSPAMVESLTPPEDVSDPDNALYSNKVLGLQLATSVPSGTTFTLHCTGIHHPRAVSVAGQATDPTEYLAGVVDVVHPLWVMSQKVPPPLDSIATSPIEHSSGLIYRSYAPMYMEPRLRVSPLGLHTKAISFNASWPGAHTSMKIMVDSIGASVTTNDTILIRLPVAYEFNHGGQTVCDFSWSEGSSSATASVIPQVSYGSQSVTARFTVPFPIAVPDDHLPLAALDPFSESYEAPSSQVVIECNNIRNPTSPAPASQDATIRVQTAFGNYISQTTQASLPAVKVSALGQTRATITLEDPTVSATTTASIYITSLQLPLVAGERIGVSLPGDFNQFTATACGLYHDTLGTPIFGIAHVDTASYPGYTTIYYELKEDVLLPSNPHQAAGISTLLNCTIVNPRTVHSARSDIRIWTETEEGITKAETRFGTLDAIVADPHFASEEHIITPPSPVVDSSGTLSVRIKPMTQDMIAGDVLSILIPVELSVELGSNMNDIHCDFYYNGVLQPGATSTQISSSPPQTAISFTLDANLTGAPSSEGLLECSKLRSSRISHDQLDYAAIALFDSQQRNIALYNEATMGGAQPKRLPDDLLRVTTDRFFPNATSTLDLSIGHLSIPLRSGDAFVLSFPPEAYFQFANPRLTNPEITELGLPATQCSLRASNGTLISGGMVQSYDSFEPRVVTTGESETLVAVQWSHLRFTLTDAVSRNWIDEVKPTNPLHLVCTRVSNPQKETTTIRFARFRTEGPSGRIMQYSDSMVIDPVYIGSLGQVTRMIKLSNSYLQQIGTLTMLVDQFTHAIWPNDRVELKLPVEFTPQANTHCHLKHGGVTVNQATTQSIVVRATANEDAHSLAVRLLPSASKLLPDGPVTLEMVCTNIRNPPLPYSQGISNIYARHITDIGALASHAHNFVTDPILPATMCLQHHEYTFGSTKLSQQTSVTASIDCPNTNIPAGSVLVLALPRSFMLNFGGHTVCSASLAMASLIRGSTEVNNHSDPKQIRFTVLDNLDTMNLLQKITITCGNIRTPRYYVGAASNDRFWIEDGATGLAIARSDSMNMPPFGPETLIPSHTTVTTSNRAPNGRTDITVSLSSLGVNLLPTDEIVIRLPFDVQLNQGGLTNCNMVRGTDQILTTTRTDSNANFKDIHVVMTTSLPMGNIEQLSLPIVITCGNIRNQPNPTNGRNDLMIRTETSEGNLMSITNTASSGSLTVVDFSATTDGLVSFAKDGSKWTVVINSNNLKWEFSAGDVLRFALPSNVIIGPDSTPCVITMWGLLTGSTTIRNTHVRSGNTIAITLLDNFPGSFLGLGTVSFKCTCYNIDPPAGTNPSNIPGVYVNGTKSGGDLIAMSKSTSGSATIFDSLLGALGGVISAPLSGETNGLGNNLDVLGETFNGATSVVTGDPISSIITPIVGSLAHNLTSSIAGSLGVSIPPVFNATTITAMIPLDWVIGENPICSLNGNPAVTTIVNRVVTVAVPDGTTAVTDIICSDITIPNSSTSQLAYEVRDKDGVLLSTSEDFYMDDVSEVAVHYSSIRHSTGVADGMGTLQMDISSINATLGSTDILEVFFPRESLSPTNLTACSWVQNGKVLTNMVTTVFNQTIRLIPNELVRGYALSEDVLAMSTVIGPEAIVPFFTNITCTYIRRGRALTNLEDVINQPTVRVRTIMNGLVASVSKGLTIHSPVTTPNLMPGSHVLIEPVSTSTAVNSRHSPPGVYTGLYGRVRTTISNIPVPILERDIFNQTLPPGFIVGNLAEPSCYLADNSGRAMTPSVRPSIVRISENATVGDVYSLAFPINTSIPVAATVAAICDGVQNPTLPTQSISGSTLPMAVRFLDSNGRLVMGVSGGGVNLVNAVQSSPLTGQAYPAVSGGGNGMSMQAISPQPLGDKIKQIEAAEVKEPGSVGLIIAKFNGPFQVPSGEILTLVLSEGWIFNESSVCRVDGSVALRADSSLSLFSNIADLSDVQNRARVLKLPFAFSSDPETVHEVACTSVRRPIRGTSGGKNGVIMLNTQPSHALRPVGMHSVTTANGTSVVRAYAYDVSIEPIYSDFATEIFDADLPSNEAGTPTTLTMRLSSLPFDMATGSKLRIVLPSTWSVLHNATCQLMQGSYNAPGVVQARFSSTPEEIKTSIESSFNYTLSSPLTRIYDDNDQPLLTKLICQGVVPGDPVRNDAPLSEQAAAIEFLTPDGYLSVRKEGAILPSPIPAQLGRALKMVSVTSALAGATNNLTLTIKPLVNTIRVGDKMTFTLPVDWTLSAGATTACKLTDNSSSNNATTSTSLYPNENRIELVFQSEVQRTNAGFALQCTNIRVPRFETSTEGTGSLSISNVAGTVRETSNDIKFPKISPNTLGSIVRAFNTSSTALGVITTLTGTIYPFSNPLPQGSRIKVDFPLETISFVRNSAGDVLSTCSIKQGSRTTNAQLLTQPSSLILVLGSGSSDYITANSEPVVITCFNVQLPLVSSPARSDIVITAYDPLGRVTELTTDATLNGFGEYANSGQSGDGSGTGLNVLPGLPVGIGGGGGLGGILDDITGDLGGGGLDDLTGGLGDLPGGIGGIPGGLGDIPGTVVDFLRRLVHTIILQRSIPLNVAEIGSLENAYQSTLGNYLSAVRVIRQVVVVGSLLGVLEHNGEKSRNPSIWHAGLASNRKSIWSIVQNIQPNSPFRLSPRNSPFLNSAATMWRARIAEMRRNNRAKEGEAQKTFASSSSQTYLQVTVELTPSNGVSVDDLSNYLVTHQQDLATESQTALPDEIIDVTSTPAPSSSPVTCEDGTLNGDETDIDCGGSCKQCSRGQQCNFNTDCDTGMCLSGTCYLMNSAFGITLPSKQTLLGLAGAALGPVLIGLL